MTWIGIAFNDALNPAMVIIRKSLESLKKINLQILLFFFSDWIKRSYASIRYWGINRL